MEITALNDSSIVSFGIIQEGNCYILIKKEIRNINSLINTKTKILDSITNALATSTHKPKTVICDFSTLNDAELSWGASFLQDFLEIVSQYRTIKYIGSISSKQAEIQSNIKEYFKPSMRLGLMTLHFSDITKAVLWAKTIK